MPEIRIRIEHLYKVFGNRPGSRLEGAMKSVREGMDKSTLLAEKGHTLGLRDINLDIYSGELFVIMGLSGSGKSTLIRHLNRLIDPSAGRILVDGADILSLNQRALLKFRRSRTAMVFQRFGLMPHRTVLDNVCYGLNVQGVKPAKRHELGRQWLLDVGLDGYENQYPSQLSGGQQQRVGLARALCTDADILLMDEAFSALDPLIRSEMQDQLIKLQARLSKTIVFITHDLDEALRLGDRIAILRAGELVQVGAPADILLHPADDYVQAFVRDVNRARALTVETVMKPALQRIDASTIGAAIEQMRSMSASAAFLVAPPGELSDMTNHYRGRVDLAALELAAQEQDAAASIPESLISSGPVAQTGDMIEQVIPDALSSEHPVPVINGDGALSGEISRAQLAAVLGEYSTERR